MTNANDNTRWRSPLAMPDPEPVQTEEQEDRAWFAERGTHMMGDEFECQVLTCTTVLYFTWEQQDEYNAYHPDWADWMICEQHQHDGIDHLLKWEMEGDHA